MILKNAKYDAMNFLFYAVFCALHSFASVYLLSKNYENSEIGIILAVSNIIIAIVTPLIAGLINRRKFITGRFIIICLGILLIIASFLLYLIPMKGAGLTSLFSFIYILPSLYMPLLTALCFEYSSGKNKINFGLARGFGSVGYALSSMFLGFMINKNSENFILVFSAIGTLALVLVLFAFRKPQENVSESDLPDEAFADGTSPEDATAKKTSMFQVLKNYPGFVLLLVATVCIFFTHHALNDFLIQVIKPLGGNAATLGNAFFVQAILELPIMIAIPFLLKKISAKWLLLISAFAFFLKILLSALATNLTMIFISQGLQLFSYAIFIPTIAYHINDLVSPKDQAKGQALVASAMTAGGIVCDFVCGWVIDDFGVKTMLYMGSIITLIGIVILWISFRKNNKELKRELL